MNSSLKYYCLFIPLLCMGLPYPNSGAPEVKTIRDMAIGHPNNPDSTIIAKLVTTIRQATERFQDTKQARAAGYRPLGPDMPNMGVHWVNTRIAVQREVDWEQPSALTYLRVNGSLELTGVAYTHPVLSGEDAPILPSEQMKWHYHSGSIEKETHGIHKQHMQRDPGKQMNLAMLHVWVWSENPDGLFAADNWALSFKRFGLQSPVDPSPEVSKALFLANGGIEYYVRFIELSARPEMINSDSIKSVIARYSKKVKNVISGYIINDQLSPEDQTRITGIWKKMWEEIKEVVNKTVWNKIKINLSHQNHYRSIS